MIRSVEAFPGNTLFHLHLRGHSSDSSLTPKQLVKTVKKLGKDKVILTDHNTVDGAIEVEEAAKAQGYDLTVIHGEEIKTGVRNEKGSEIEVVAFPLKETIPPGLAIPDTLLDIQKQKAVLALVHPFDETRHGAGAMIGEAILRQAKKLGITVCVEVFNSRANRDQNEKALVFYQQMNDKYGGIVPIAGSDAHSALELWRSSMHLHPCRTQEELFQNFKTSSNVMIIPGDDNSARTVFYRGLLWVNPRVLANRFGLNLWGRS